MSNDASPAAAQVEHLEHVDDDWPSLFAPARRARLAEVLAGWARARRWFRGKARTIRAARVADVVKLDDVEVVVVVLRLEYAEGEGDAYVLPLAFAASDDPQSLAQQLPGGIVAWLDGRGGAGAGAIVDGLATGQAILPLAALARDGSVGAGERGALRGEGGVALSQIFAAGPLNPKVSAQEQTNSSVVLGDRVLLKIYRLLASGPNPELELGRFLSAHPRRPATPHVLGALSYRDREGREHGIGILHEFLRNDGDAWSRVERELARAFERAASGKAIDEEREGFVADAVTLGRRLGELHLALVDTDAGTPDPNFSPEPLTERDRAEAAARTTAMLSRVLGALRERRSTLEPRAQADVARLVEPGDPARVALDALLTQFRDEPLSVVKTRIHGDLHLGQVLCRGDDFVIIDFEGEPGRSLADRRAKTSPVRDVVGMMRSFDYAPEAVLRGPTWSRTAVPSAVTALAVAWKRGVTDAFLRGYLEQVEDAPFLPVAPNGSIEPRQWSLMLRFFELERVVYELDYELNNRPEWIDIPLRGLLAIGTRAQP